MAQFDDKEYAQILGSQGRLELWRNGKGSLTDLVDETRKPLYRLKLAEQVESRPLVPDLNREELLSPLSVIIPSMSILTIPRDVGVQYSVQRTGWSDSKHDAIIHGDIDAVKSHQNYKAAKSGSLDDSILLAKEFMYVDGICKRYNSPIILPIMAEEKQGKNAIPLGMLEAIQDKTGWYASDSIYQSNRAGHTGATGWHRLAAPATFEGDVIEGAEYLIVDDFIGMGGTLANLKSFVENSGAKVVGYEILTGKDYSSRELCTSKR